MEWNSLYYDNAYSKHYKINIAISDQAGWLAGWLVICLVVDKKFVI